MMQEQKIIKAKVAQDGIVLTEAQLQAWEKMFSSALTQVIYFEECSA